jgi:hypothetical protein
MFSITIGSGGAPGVNGGSTTIQIDDTMIIMSGGLAASVQVSGNGGMGGNGGSVTIKNSITISVDGKLGGMPGQYGLDTIANINQRIFGGASYISKSNQD